MNAHLMLLFERRIKEPSVAVIQINTMTKKCNVLRCTEKYNYKFIHVKATFKRLPPVNNPSSTQPFTGLPLCFSFMLWKWYSHTF